MTERKVPSTPADAYKAIIDQLAAETSHGVSEELIVQEGIFSRASDQDEFNELVRSMSPEQRSTLAQMLHAERTSAIHDALAVLSWWAEAGGLAFRFDGKAMPIGFSGMGMHGDYVGRQNGWTWPDD